MSSSMISETDKLNKENVASGRQLQIDFIIQLILQNLMIMVAIIIITRNITIFNGVNT